MSDSAYQHSALGRRQLFQSNASILQGSLHSLRARATTLSLAGDTRVSTARPTMSSSVGQQYLPVSDPLAEILSGDPHTHFSEMLSGFEGPLSRLMIFVRHYSKIQLPDFHFF